jgi:hypothetical protein
MEEDVVDIVEVVVVMMKGDPTLAKTTIAATTVVV